MAQKKTTIEINPNVILDTLPTLVTTYNIFTGKYLYVSKRISDLLGYSQQDFFQGGVAFVSSLMHPDDLKEVLIKNEKALKRANSKNYRDENSVESFEYRIKHKNGKWHWFLTQGTVFSRDKKGNIESVMNISIDITDRKEKELQEEKEFKIVEELSGAVSRRLAAIVEFSTDAIIGFSLSGIITNWNKAAEKMYGYSEKEAVGKHITLIVPKKLHKEEHEIIARIAKGIYIDHFETTRLRKDGQQIDVFLSISPIKDAKGKIIGASKIARDITQEKAIREQIRLSEAKYRRLFESDIVGIFTSKFDGTILEANDEFLQMIGYSRDELEKGKIQSEAITPPDYYKVSKKAVEDLKTKGSTQPYEKEYIHKNGKRISVIIAVTRIEEKKDMCIGFVLDISEQKKLEENLRFLSEASKLLASSLDYKVTLQNVARIAVSHIADWCGIDIVMDNGVFEQLALAHKDPKMVKWAKQYRKLNPQTMSNDTSTIVKTVKTQKSLLIEKITQKMLIESSNDEKSLELAKSLHLTSVMMVPIVVNKNAIGIISFISTDDKRHYTKSDLTMAEELASRAALAIQNSRLFSQSQQAVSLRDDFISIASHELKTPVTSLKMYAQVLERQIEKKGVTEHSKYFERMNSQINKLTILISDLLNVTRMQVGKLEFREETFEIDELVHEVVENIAPTSGHKILVEGSVKKQVFGDPYRIGQVITNLLTNALKYSPQADKVVVSLSQGKNTAVVSVQDFGIGIDKEHQKKIFKRFYRVNNKEEKTFPGLGIGLYISHEIIKRHNGKLSLVSSKGKGSTFSFTIPYK